jgi:hypothetical protein
MNRVTPATSELADRIKYDFYRSYNRSWNMENGDRMAMLALLSMIKPACSIEIGTREGGSLAVIAEHSGKVFTLDLDPNCREASDCFPNAELVVGMSQETLPGVIRKIEEQGLSLEFVLVDGDHSEAGVRGDIECLLKYKPKKPCYIVMHDGFNPFCREGMASAPWESSPHVHSVDLDFVQGRYYAPDATFQGMAVGSQMWQGLGLAVMRPEERVGPLTILGIDDAMYTLALRHSAHHLVMRAKQWLGPVKYRKLRDALGKGGSDRLKKLLIGGR